MTTATKAAAAAVQGKTTMFQKYIPALAKCKTEEESLHRLEAFRVRIRAGGGGREWARRQIEAGVQRVGRLAESRRRGVSADREGRGGTYKRDMRDYGSARFATFLNVPCALFLKVAEIWKVSEVNSISSKSDFMYGILCMFGLRPQPRRWHCGAPEYVRALSGGASIAGSRKGNRALAHGRAA